MHIRIKNRETGEEVVLDTSQYRWKRLARGFLNTLRTSGPFFLKHITLTQREENYHPRILDSFFHKLRRFYGRPLPYIWTVEEQKRGVLHWHCIVAFPYDDDFGASDVLRIQKYWKYGNVDIKPVRRPSMGYLMKYLGKALGSDIPFSVRRIGSSFIPFWLRMSWKKLVDAISWFVRFGIGIDSFKQFYWDRLGAYQYFYDDLGRREKIRIFSFPPSPWYLVEVVEAF